MSPNLSSPFWYHYRKNNNVDKYIRTDTSLSYSSTRVPEIKPIFLLLVCFIFQNALGIVCLQGRNKQVSDVDLKGYFLIQRISFRKHYELCREIMSFWWHARSFMYILNVYWWYCVSVGEITTAALLCFYRKLSLCCFIQEVIHFSGDRKRFK